MDEWIPKILLIGLESARLTPCKVQKGPVNARHTGNSVSSMEEVDANSALNLPLRCCTGVTLLTVEWC